MQQAEKQAAINAVKNAASANNQPISDAKANEMAISLLTPSQATSGGSTALNWSDPSALQSYLNSVLSSSSGSNVSGGGQNNDKYQVTVGDLINPDTMETIPSLTPAELSNRYNRFTAAQQADIDKYYMDTFGKNLNDYAKGLPSNVTVDAVLPKSNGALNDIAKSPETIKDTLGFNTLSDPAVIKTINLQEAPRAPEVNYVSGILRSAADGAIPLDLADNLEAGLRSMFGDETYNQALYDINMNKQVLQNEAPYLDAGAKIAGVLGASALTGGVGPLDAYRINDIINSDFSGTLKTYPLERTDNFNLTPIDTSGNVTGPTVSGGGTGGSFLGDVGDTLSGVVDKVGGTLSGIADSIYSGFEWNPLGFWQDTSLPSWDGWDWWDEWGWSKGGSVHKYAEGGKVENQDLQALDQKYYLQQINEARNNARAEQQAFNNMLQKHVQSGESPESKAEMYFRLAAALGAPTKTGGLGETISNAAQAFGEYQQGARKEAANKLELALQAQKMKSQAAADEVKSLNDLYKEYMTSGKPQSAAGKQALDEGLTPGTPEYTARVSKIGDLMNQAKEAQITSSLGNLATSQASLQNALTTQQLNQAKFQAQQAERAKLTPQELKMKEETEGLVSSADQALADLQQAYKLNPNTFDTSAMDTAQRTALELAGSKDPKVINTRLQENLLGEQALEKLKATFGTSPTEGERGILLSLQGINAKSKEERAEIIKHAYQTLKDKKQVHQNRLNQINQGLYRSTVATPEIGE